MCNTFQWYKPVGLIPHTSVYIQYCDLDLIYVFNPFTAEVAIMRLLGSAPKSHLCDQKRRSKVTGLSYLMTLFIDLGGLYCKQTQRAFNVFKNTLNWLKIDSVDQKFYLECGNFSQDAGTPGTQRIMVFSQPAVKGLMQCTLYKLVCFTVSAYWLHFDNQSVLFIVMGLCVAWNSCVYIIMWCVVNKCVISVCH
jgi:hypothetical protein